MSEKFVITDEDREEINRRNQYNIKSNLNFLKQQRGFRKGLLHTLMAPKGSGKSTLVRSIIIDYLINNPGRRVFVYLSEESVLSLKASMDLYSGYLFEGDGSRLYCISEQDQEENFSFESLQDHFIKAIDQEGCDLFIFDNITSSKFYEGRNHEAQSKFITGLKNSTAHCDVATLVIAHTGKKANQEKLLSGDDVRGSNLITIVTEFLYLSQMVQVGNKKKHFLHIEKHRPCNVANTFFFLEYDEHEMLYKKDRSVNFNEFRDWFKQRNRL